MTTGIPSEKAAPVLLIWRCSIFDGEPLPDLIDPLVQRIEARVQGTIMQVENIAERHDAKDPVMGLDVAQHRFDHMADEEEDTQHHVHCISPGGSLIPEKTGL